MRVRASCRSARVVVHFGHKLGSSAYDILKTSPGFLDPGLDWSSPHGQVRLVFHLMFVCKTAHNPVGVIYRWQASQQMNRQTREPKTLAGLVILRSDGHSSHQSHHTGRYRYIQMNSKACVSNKNQK